MKCGALLFYCASLLTAIFGQVPVLQPGSVAFNLTVANGTDVTVQAQCVNGSWSIVPVVTVLQQYGPSQQNGLLSAFPATQFNFTSLNCTARELSSPVGFNTVNTFFFRGLPTYSAFAGNLTGLCSGSVPNIPEANVTVTVQRNYGYCQAGTQRGYFRSSSIQIPDFLVQPQNISVAADTTAVSLSCAVTPGSSAQSIQWYYQAKTTMAPTLLTSSSTVVIESLIPGASVLVLQNQSISLLPGLYHCQAILTNQTTLNSSMASIDNSSGQYIVPTPPSSLQIAFGESGFLSYVPADGGPINCSNYGTLTVNITAFTAYIVKPPVGEQTITCSNYTTRLIVSAPLGFNQSLGDYETVVRQGSNISLLCSANSSGAQIQWMRNMVPSSITGNVWNLSNVQRSDSGMYQCVVQPSNTSQYAAVVSSTYLNVYFSNSVNITFPNGSNLLTLTLNLSDPATPPYLTLLCTVDAHPPPSIMWTRNGQTYMNGTIQKLSDFMGPATSQLNVSTSSLSYVELFGCLASQANLNTSVNITTFTLPNITSLTPVNISTEGTVVMLMCEAMGQPPPTITWSGVANAINVTAMVVGGRMRSILTFNATRQQNGTSVVCQASSMGGVVSQSVPLIVQATPDSSPANLMLRPTANSIYISWIAVIAFPVASYYVNVTLQAPPSVIGVFNANGTSLLVPNLLPFRNYTVTITPFNTVGNGPTANGSWTTLEAAPSAPPQNITLSMIEVRQITILWVQPPAADQNGVIIAYQVIWGVNSTNTSNTSYTITGLTPGTSYQVQVAAVTRAGVGVFSNPLGATTLSTPPVSTPAAGTAVGPIVGGVIGGLAGVLVIVLVVGLVYVAMQRQNSHKGYSLPPRKGSIRLPETSVIKPPKSLPIPFHDIVLENQHQPLIVEQFAHHVKQLHANSDHLFSEEYELFTIKSPNLPHVASCLPCNINKNRYANINSFDDTRVCLSLNPGIEGSDYINANYIDGFQQKHAYIATQGPLPSTTYDFWKMVWEQNSCCIIMLTNLVEKTRAKCHQYWPEVGAIILEDLVITLVETQELAYYTIRTFQMNKGEESCEVKQFHYTGWPDFGVPEMPHPLIAFVRRLENFKRTTDGPDIIHCSAGVGRTGTLIAIQELIKMANVERKVDVFNFALELRKQRSYMIQTEHQYIFIHDTLLEVIRAGNTQTSLHRLQEKYRELQDLSKQPCDIVQEFERVQELQVVKPTQFTSAKLPPNTPKNRNTAALPYDLHRVRLLMQPGVTGSDYINATFVDGYERKHQYILAQGPLRNTVDDFWRMIWEHRVYAIVMLCCVEENDIEQCVQYWPTEKVKQYGDLFVQLNKENNQTSSTIYREITVKNTKIDESRSLKLYQYTDWEETVCPADCGDILGLIATVHKPQQHHNGPVVIHDGSSLGRAGSFAVISACLEQLKAEGVADIMFTLLSMRQQVSGIVPSLDYYRFCYKAVVEYLNSFQQYSNFD